ELVGAESREEETRTGQPGQLHRADGAAPRRLLPGLERVRDLTGPWHGLDPGELHPLDVAHDGNSHEVDPHTWTPSRVSRCRREPAAVRALLRRAPRRDLRIPGPPPGAGPGRGRLPGDVPPRPPRLPEAAPRRAPARVAVHDRRADRDRRAPPAASRRR